MRTANQWFESLADELNWSGVQNQFINRLTDAKDFLKVLYPDYQNEKKRDGHHPEFIAKYQTKNCMEFFVRSLTPPSIKQNAHQLLKDNAGTTWQQLQDQVSNIDKR